MIGRRGSVRMLPTLLTAGVALAEGDRVHVGNEPVPANRDAAVAEGQHQRVPLLPLGSSDPHCRPRPAQRRSSVVVRPGVARRPAAAPDARGRCRRRCNSGRLPRVRAAESRISAPRSRSFRSRSRPSSFRSLIVLSGAVLYDGIRQVLFGLPALLAIPAVALAVLERRQARPPLGRVVLPLAAVVVVAASLVSSIRWAPYAYAYLNPIAASSKEGSWELDYWGVSGKEGVERLERLGLRPGLRRADRHRRHPLGRSSRTAATRGERGPLCLPALESGSRLRMHGHLHDQARRARAR